MQISAKLHIPAKHMNWKLSWDPIRGFRSQGRSTHHGMSTILTIQYCSLCECYGSNSIELSGYTCRMSWSRPSKTPDGTTYFASVAGSSRPSTRLSFSQVTTHSMSFIWSLSRLTLEGEGVNDLRGRGSMTRKKHKGNLQNHIL